MEDLAIFFFQLSTQIKLYHWQTTSYARHIASDTLYTTLLPLIDKFMEILQGKLHSRVHLESDEAIVKLRNLSNATMYDFLEKSVMYLQSLESMGMLHHDDTDLINIRDDMMGTINQTLYLFTFQ